MNNLYCFIDENTIQKWDEKYVIVNGKQISYPSEDILKEAGIKPLIEDKIPNFDEITQWVIEYYEDAEDVIIKHWRVENIPSMEEVVEDEQIAID